MKTLRYIVLVLLPTLFPSLSLAGLIAHYEFDGDLVDSESAHVATGFGDLSYIGGVSGQALNLDNGPTSSFFYVNEYVQLQEMTFGSEFSLAHWVRFDSNAFSSRPGHVAATFSLGRGGGTAFRTQVTREGDISAAVGGGGTGGGTEFVNINDGEFHHVAVTVDSGSISFYLDGVLWDVDLFSVAPTIGTLDGFVGLHQWFDGGVRMSSRFDGAIDDLRIYDHTLTAAEIEEIVGVPGPGGLALLGLGLFAVFLRKR